MKGRLRSLTTITKPGLYTSDAGSLRESSHMMEALPRLRALFREKANENSGVFPLMSRKHEASMWKNMNLRSNRHAAVLVPLVSWEGVPSLLFTVRSKDLPTHASEVSFPGGHHDISQDTNLEETALREAQEELLGESYPWDSVVLLGRATDVPSITGTPVTPVVAVFPYEINATTFPGHDGEVEEVFHVPLDALVEMETSQSSERFRTKIPVFPATHRIWGLTAVIAQPLLHQLFRPIFLNGKSSSSAASRL